MNQIFQFLIFLLMAALIIISCTDSGKTDPRGKTDNPEDSALLPDDPPATGQTPEIDHQRIYLNPNNFLAGQIELEVQSADRVYAEYGTTAETPFKTPAHSTSESTHLKIDILGLQPNTLYYARPAAISESGVIVYGQTATFTTEPWTAENCLPEPTIYRNDPRWPETEVFCYTCNIECAYMCIDRTATPVWYFSNFEAPPDSEVQALSDGNFAYASQMRDTIVVFTPAGETVAEISLVQLQGQTRFEHISFHHELIELTDGAWPGALAVLTNTIDLVTFAPLDGPIDPLDTQYLNYPYADITEPYEEYIKSDGIVVIDYSTGNVLWDWSLNGEPGDNSTIDPKMISYTRRGLAGNMSYIPSPIDWTHANALVHGTDENGEFFWLNLRHQDWIIKIDVASDTILWRLGYQGDFTLVDDIDATSPAPVTEASWFFHQHAPEWIEHEQGRYRFTIFDNGNVRPVDFIYTDHEYSRVAIFEIDEQSRLAQIDFEFGEQDRTGDNFFYGWAYGDADLMPAGESILYSTGHKLTGLPYPYVGEVSMLDGQLMRKFLFYLSVYRVDYYPSIYQTTWWYNKNR